MMCETMYHSVQNSSNCNEGEKLSAMVQSSPRCLNIVMDNIVVVSVEDHLYSVLGSTLSSWCVFLSGWTRHTCKCGHEF